MKAADFANYARVPTPADIDALRDLGITRVIVGSSFSQRQPDGTYRYVAADQMAVCEAAGFEVHEFMFIGRVYPTKRTWWLDVELAETPDEIRAAVAIYRPDGIYTRKGIWDLLDIDLVSEFPGLKLWDANYGPLPRPFRPYGGWDRADMTQYHDTMDIGTGFEVDLSVYEETGRMYTDAEIDAKVAEALALGVRNQTNIGQLANGIDAVSVANKWPLSLKGLWFIAGKAWPF